MAGGKQKSEKVRVNIWKKTATLNWNGRYKPNYNEPQPNPTKHGNYRGGAVAQSVGGQTKQMSIRSNMKEETHIKFVTNFINVEHKKKPGDTGCIAFDSKHFRWVMRNLEMSPMKTNHNQAATAVHRLEM